MQRAYFSTKTDTAVFETSRYIGVHQTECGIADFPDLVASDRESAFLSAVDAFSQQEASDFCVVLTAGTAVYTAGRGASQVYLAVMDAKDDLVHASKIGFTRTTCEREILRTTDQQHALGYQISLPGAKVVTKKSIFSLPPDSHAFVLHEAYDMLDRLPLDTHELHLGRGALATTQLHKLTLQQNGYLMVAPLERKADATLLCYTKAANRSETFAELLDNAICTPLFHSRTMRRRYLLHVLSLHRQCERMENILNLLAITTSLPERVANHTSVMRELLLEAEMCRQEARVDDCETVEGKIEKCLFALYLDVYKYCPQTRLLVLGPHRLSAIKSSLENYFEDRFPELKTEKLHRLLNEGRLANHILWRAGLTYPQFVDEAEQFLQHFAEEKVPATERKALFTNTGKLLTRLGDTGYQRSQTFFAHKDLSTRVKSSEIEAFYDKQQVTQKTTPG